MPLTDDQWRFIVEDLLGVRPGRCEALVAAIAQSHPEPERASALAKSFLPRAMMIGVPTGTTEALPGALVLALIEQRAVMRQRATLLASLGLLDDPRFFERSEWPRRALGIEQDEGGALVVAREGARFALRFAVVRGSRRATRWLGRRAASVIGAGVGAAFNTVEQLAFAKITLAAHERARARVEAMAQVIPLRRSDHRRRHERTRGT